MIEVRFTLPFIRRLKPLTKRYRKIIPTGKSGGYRVIYQVVSTELILLLLIYAKSDQADMSLDEIKDDMSKA